MNRWATAARGRWRGGGSGSCRPTHRQAQARQIKLAMLGVLQKDGVRHRGKGRFRSVHRGTVRRQDGRGGARSLTTSGLRNQRPRRGHLHVLLSEEGKRRLVFARAHSVRSLCRSPRGRPEATSYLKLNWKPRGFDAGVVGVPGFGDDAGPKPNNSEGVKAGVAAVPEFDAGVVGVPAAAGAGAGAPKLHDSEGAKPGAAAVAVFAAGVVAAPGFVVPDGVPKLHVTDGRRTDVTAVPPPPVEPFAGGADAGFPESPLQARDGKASRPRAKPDRRSCLVMTCSSSDSALCGR